jgi:hypothetical protein
VILAAGLAQRADLPIPPIWVGVAASVVLVVSFWALALLWRAPRLEGRAARPGLPVPAALEVGLGALGVALFALVVYAGVAGNPTVQGNLAPTFVFVVLWVGGVIASLLVGDVFALLSPWRALARAARRVAARRGRPAAAPVPYPGRLGRWPAAAGVLAFAWLQVIYDRGTDPRLLGVLAVAYAAAMLAGMARYGIDTWSARADTFGVVFGLVATLAPLQIGAGRVRGRRPLSGATRVVAVPGTVAVVCALIGATAYDGLRTTAVWTGDVRPVLRASLSETAAATAGLLGITALVALVYLAGTRRVGAARFAHSLIPIAAAYVLAHELTLLLFQGQATVALASDPLGLGSDLLGTATVTPDFTFLSDGAVWGLEIAVVLAGHVAALALAHDRALVSEGDPDRASRTQVPVLVVMVAFTSLALWLLASINA